MHRLTHDRVSLYAHNLWFFYIKVHGTPESVAPHGCCAFASGIVLAYGT